MMWKGIGGAIVVLVLGVFAGALLPPAAAQGGPASIIMANDSATGATVAQVGDTTNEAIRVNVVAGAAGGGDVNLIEIAGNAVDAGNGVSGTGTLRVTIASNSTGTVAVTNTGTFAAQVTGTVTANAGTNLNTALLALESGGNLAAAATSLALLDNAISGAGFNITQFAGVGAQTGSGTATGALRVELPTNGTGVVGLNAGTAFVGSVAPTTTAVVTNSAVPCYLTTAASTNATNCKASAGNVYGIRAVNTTTTTYYLRMYNLAVAPTCSSATGFIETIPIPSTTTGAGFMSFPGIGQGFDTGIGFCVTGGGSSTDNTNAATGVYFTILYK